MHYSCFFLPQPKVLHSIKMPLGQTLQIVQTDIAELSVDAVVNPTSSTLYMGGMVGSRLMAVGGAAFAKVIEGARTDISHLQKNGGNFIETCSLMALTRT